MLHNNLQYTQALRKLQKRNDIKADLHVHTHASDGTLGIADYSKLAEHMNVDFIAFADHNTIGESLGFSEYCKKRNVPTNQIFIPGGKFVHMIGANEVTCRAYQIQRGKERFRKIHMVVIGADRDESLHFNKLMTMKHYSDIISDTGVFGYLNIKYGFDFSIEEALVQRALIKSEKRKTDNYDLTPMDYWEVCSKKKNMKNIKYNQFAQAVNTANSEIAKLGRLNLDSKDVIKLAHSAGGLAIWAHPGLNEIDEKKTNDTSARNSLTSLINNGLDGIELYYGQTNNTIFIDPLNHPCLYKKSNDKYYPENLLLKSGGCDMHNPDSIAEQRLLGYARGSKIKASSLNVLDKLLDMQENRINLDLQGKSMPYGNSPITERILSRYEKQYEIIKNKADKFINYENTKTKPTISADKKTVDVACEFFTTKSCTTEEADNKTNCSIENYVHSKSNRTKKQDRKLNKQKKFGRANDERYIYNSTSYDQDLKLQKSSEIMQYFSNKCLNNKQTKCEPQASDNFEGDFRLDVDGPEMH